MADQLPAKLRAWADESHPTWHGAPMVREAADTIDAQAAEIERLSLCVSLWQALYRRAINEANGLTNYVEERPELRRAERNLTAIEADARAALEQTK